MCLLPLLPFRGAWGGRSAARTRARALFAPPEMNTCLTLIPKFCMSCSVQAAFKDRRGTARQHIDDLEENGRMTRSFYRMDTSIKRRST